MVAYRKFGRHVKHVGRQPVKRKGVANPVEMVYKTLSDSEVPKLLFGG